MKRTVHFVLIFILCCFTRSILSVPHLNISRIVYGLPCAVLADKDRFIGCTSDRDGNHGALWPIDATSDIDEFEKHPPKGDRIIVMGRSFTRENVERLIKTNRVSGILVLPGEAPVEGFSPADQYPNKKFGLYPNSEHVWNPWGTSFNFDLFKIPMFFVPSGFANYYKIHQLSLDNKKNKDDWPQWGVTLKAFMHASGTSESCLRRNQCQPLGGKSTWSTFDPVDKTKNIILVIAAVDANAFFHDMAIGADAAVSSAVTLIATAEALAKVHNSSGPFPKQIVFGFFQGEEWGFIGSKRFVKDINSFKCKKKSSDDSCDRPFSSTLAFEAIDLNKIEAIVEVGHVGNINAFAANTVYAHFDKPDISLSLVNSFKNAAKKSGLKVEDAWNGLGANPGIPPSSSMAFLKERPNIPNIVLTEFKSQYTNKYYGSRFDQRNLVNTDSVVNVATLLANTLLNMVNVDTQLNITVNTSLVDTMLNCLSDNYACPLMKRYLGNYYYSPDPSQYVSVWRPNTILNVGSKFYHDIMFDLTKRAEAGECKTMQDCDVKAGYECIRSKCLLSSTYFHEALSPAFEYDYQTGVFHKTEFWDTEPTWTESDWQSTTIELYRMSSPASGIVVLVFGILVVILSFGVVYALKTNLIRRFKMP